MTGEPTGSIVELNWLPPLHPDGAVHYEIEYEPAMTPGDPVNAGSSSSPYFTLTLPNEFLTYNVTVAAVNTQGQARSGDLTILCPGRNTEEGMTTEHTLVSVAYNCICPQDTAVCEIIKSVPIHYPLLYVNGMYIHMAMHACNLLPQVLSLQQVLQLL